jgi:hypothetical protein
MNAMAGDNPSNDNEGGPMWGRFFDSIGHDEEGSALSGSFRQHTDLHSFSSVNDLRSPHSEVHPNDSASVVDEHDDHASAISGFARGGHKGGAHSSLAPVPVDDGTYVFKFRTPSGRTHRFQSRHDNIEHLREIVAGKLANDPFFTEMKDSSEDLPDPSDFLIQYTDADGDTVLMTSDHDVTDAVKIARGANTDRVVLFVQGGKGWAEAGAGKSEAKAAEASAAALEEKKEVEKAEVAAAVAAMTPVAESATPIPVVVEPKVIPSDAPKHVRSGPEEVFGIPKDLLLPASIGVLAVVIIGVFTISRLSSNPY